MEQEASGVSKGKIRYLKRPLAIGLLAALCLIVIGFALRYTLQPKSLFPGALARQSNHFVPYFYFDKVPAGYTLDVSKSSANDTALLMTLTKAGEPPLVLSEQQLPDRLSREEIFQNGEKVDVANGRATINSVEGRLVGAYTPSEHDLLILLNAPGQASKDDMKLLLQALKPVR
ncbi:MAG TPA: hypothetical protein VLI54_05925 [Bacillota bacterium]|nr:hypothetical protein [Bacillota bacterium]